MDDKEQAEKPRVPWEPYLTLCREFVLACEAGEGRGTGAKALEEAMSWRRHPVPDANCRYGFVICGGVCAAMYGQDLAWSAAFSWGNRALNTRPRRVLPHRAEDGREWVRCGDTPEVPREPTS